ncbi:MAG: M10 family metallopeptidase domain-containing protein [Planctomycetota bacterium]|jgi:hypothetical protein
MATKKTVWTITIAFLALIGTMQAQLQLHVDYITFDNIGRMAETDFIPVNHYKYRFINGAADISDGSDFDAVRRAFDTWIGEPLSDLSSFESTRIFDFTPGVGNFKNDISWVGHDQFGYNNPWADLLGYSSQTLAVALTWYYPSTGTVSERDLYFNDVNFDWRTGTDGVADGGFNIEHIALHEIGHLYGLVDIYNPGSPYYQAWMGLGNEDLTMYGYSGWSDNDVTLSPLDSWAMSLLHPSFMVPEANPAIMFVMAGGILFFVRKP